MLPGITPEERVLLAVLNIEIPDCGPFSPGFGSDSNDGKDSFWLDLLTEHARQNTIIEIISVTFTM